MSSGRGKRKLPAWMTKKKYDGKAKKDEKIAK
jgi:hypothetical protein